MTQEQIKPTQYEMSDDERWFRLWWGWDESYDPAARPDEEWWKRVFQKLKVRWTALRVPPAPQMPGVKPKIGWLGKLGKGGNAILWAFFAYSIGKDAWNWAFGGASTPDLTNVDFTKGNQYQVFDDEAHLDVGWKLETAFPGFQISDESDYSHPTLGKGKKVVLTNKSEDCVPIKLSRYEDSRAHGQAGGGEQIAVDIMSNVIICPPNVSYTFYELKTSIDGAPGQYHEYFYGCVGKDVPPTRAIFIWKKNLQFVEPD